MCENTAGHCSCLEPLKYSKTKSNEVATLVIKMYWVSFNSNTALSHRVKKLSFSFDWVKQWCVLKEQLTCTKNVISNQDRVQKIPNEIVK